MERLRGAHSCGLASLQTLDRSLLHVFVVGPGTGEAIAIALPERGWVLVDGCRSEADTSGEFLPVRWLLHRFRSADDPVRAMILTHPHSDHADGFGELLIELAPEHVGLASPDPPEKTLVALFDEAVSAKPYDAEADRRTKQVEAAFKAMKVWEERRGSRVTGLRDGSGFSWGDVEFAVRAPTEKELVALLGSATPETVGRVANRMSLVLELCVGGLRIVLGGDMPHQQGGRTVPEGWAGILHRHPQPVQTHGLKVPHHGSREALCDNLLRETLEGCWWVTPFASSSLPRGQADEASDVIEGMTMLLAHQECVQLTALPTRCAQQRHLPSPGYVTQSEWNETFHAKDLGGILARRAIEVGPPPGALPGEPIWVAAFDLEGQWRHRWRGAVAMDVRRDAAR